MQQVDRCTELLLRRPFDFHAANAGAALAERILSDTAAAAAIEAEAVQRIAEAAAACAAAAFDDAPSNAAALLPLQTALLGVLQRAASAADISLARSAAFGAAEAALRRTQHLPAEATGPLQQACAALLQGVAAPFEQQQQQQAAELAALCTGILGVAKAASDASSVLVLNAAWKLLRQFLQSGRGFLRDMFPVGDTIAFLATQFLHVLKPAVDGLCAGNFDDFHGPFTFSRFYLRHLSFLCKTFASSLGAEDVRWLSEFFCNARALTPPCIKCDGVPEGILSGLRTHVGAVLDSIFGCVYESLYPPSEALALIKQLSAPPPPPPPPQKEESAVPRLLALFICAKSRQSFMDSGTAEHVVTHTLQRLFDMLPQCSDALLCDAASLEYVFQSLAAVIETAAGCMEIEGILFCIDATLLRYTLHSHPLVSSLATRLWIRAFSHGDIDYRLRETEAVLAAISEVNEMKAHVPTPRNLQLLHVLSGFCSISGAEIRDLVLSRMLLPAVASSALLGQWEPSPAAVMLFSELPLGSLAGSRSQRPFSWFLSNFVAALRRTDRPAVAAMCIHGIVRHPELHGSELSTDALADAADAAAACLCAGKPLPAHAVSSLLGVLASTLPYAKPAALKAVLALLAQLAASPAPDIEHDIAEFAGECACVPLDIVPSVSVVFRKLLSAATSDVSLCHTLRCFHLFASSCANEADVTASVPQERQDDLEIYLGVTPPPQSHLQQPSSSSPPSDTATIAAATVDSNALASSPPPVPLDELASLVSRLADGLAKLPPSQQRQPPEPLRGQLARLVALLRRRFEPTADF